MTAVCDMKRALDIDGFVIPPPRAPKKAKTQCNSCGEPRGQTAPLFCSAEDCDAAIDCNCHDICAGPSGRGNCDMLWCKTHAPRLSIICRIDDCFSVMCAEHTSSCRNCSVDACAVHAAQWKKCSGCAFMVCDHCAVTCSRCEKHICEKCTTACDDFDCTASFCPDCSTQTCNWCAGQ